MRKKRRLYSAAYQVRALDLCRKSDRSIAEVARDLGVQYGTLWNWMRKAGETGGTVPIEPPQKITAATTTAAALEAENERLRRELEEVKKERDFLKKAAAFFAQQSK
jgi:transposase